MPTPYPILWLIWLIWLILGLGAVLLLTMGVHWVVKGLWNAAVSQYAQHTPAADAIVRKYQSFSINNVNMGKSVHVAVDAHFLHLTPVAAIQWFGTMPVSIPWEDMELVKRGGRIMPATARLANGKMIAGPRWCLELASPTSDHDPPTGRAGDE